MAYSTQADVQNAVGGLVRLTEIADWDNDRTPDTDVITAKIAEADAEIDSFINKQYLVPLNPPPPVVVKLSARRVKFYLLDARGMVDEATTKQYDADTKWLEGVRDGLISLGVDPAPPQATMRLDASTPRPCSKDVSRKKLHGFS